MYCQRTRRNVRFLPELKMKIVILVWAITATIIGIVGMDAIQQYNDQQIAAMSGIDVDQ